MKKLILFKRTSLLIILMLSISLSGCASIAGGLLSRFLDGNDDPALDEPVEVKSEDGAYSVMAPKSWVETDELSPDAQISLMNARKEQYLICITERLIDFDESTTLEDFYDLVIINMKAAMQNASLTQPVNEMLNGAEAMSVELSGTVEKMKVTYFITLYKTKSSFTQVIGWTLLSKTDENREIITQAVRSFKELDS